MTAKSAAEKKSIPLHTRILAGLLLGAIAGVTTNLVIGVENIQGFVTNFTEPVGRMWLSALIMVVIPLIISTLSLGVNSRRTCKKSSVTSTTRFEDLATTFEWPM